MSLMTAPSEDSSEAASLRAATVGSELIRLARGLQLAVLPILVGLHVGSTAFGGETSFLPWRPRMVDLDVYLLAGRVLLEGGDIYHLPDSLPYLYPPFAAILAVPLAVLPAPLVQIGWVIANVVAVMAILYRLGLTGWPLALITTGVIYFVEPVNQTLAFGQVGIFMVALIVVDLVPGPRLLPGRRLLPLGVLTGLATAIKLTPGLFVVYLLAARKFKATLTAGLSMVAVTLLSAIIAPAQSLNFWGRLAHGDTGLGDSVVYFTNQSVLGSWMRIFGVDAAPGGLALSAVVALLGVWAGLLWYRQGRIALAVSLCGVAGLLASPVSWSHHFVWIVPLGACLMIKINKELPAAFKISCWLFIGWVAAAPFKRLPGGADVELSYSAVQNLVASTTVLLGLIVIITGIVVALRARQVGLRTRRRPLQPPTSAGADAAGSQ